MLWRPVPRFSAGEEADLPAGRQVLCGKGVLGATPKSRGIERGFGRNPVAGSGAAPRGLRGFRFLNV